ncbi:MAG: CDP-alcohol phosphatidyltransferase family protein [Candidatus Binatia bacterium]
MRAQSGNLLTGLRVVLTPAFVAAVWFADAASVLRPASGLLFLVIAATDVWDGRLARRYGHESSAGRTFDHLADIGFILCALSTYVLQSQAPWWVPAAVGGSFVFYVFDSWARGGWGAPSLIGSRIGHVAGICNYSLVGVLAFNNTAAIHLLPPSILSKLFWLVPLYSAAAVLSRAVARNPRQLRSEPERFAALSGPKR